MQVRYIFLIICVFIPLINSSELQEEEINLNTTTTELPVTSVTSERINETVGDIEDETIKSRESTLRSLVLELNQTIHDSENEASANEPIFNIVNAEPSMIDFSSRTPESSSATIYHSSGYPTNILRSSTVAVSRNNYNLRRPQCVVSKAKVQGLKEAVDRALQNIKAYDEPANCDYNSYANADNCVEIFKLIQCGMSHLTQAYVESLDNKKTSLEQFQRIQNALEQLRDQNRKEINDLKSSMSAQYLTKLENLQKRINSLSLRLKETLEELRNANYQLIISYIHNNNIDKAGKLFNNKIDDTAKLKEIIVEAYKIPPTNDERQKYINILRIEDFISHINSAYNRLVGFDWMAKVLRDNGDMDGNSIINRLRHKFQDALRDYDYKGQPTHLSQNFPKVIDNIFWGKFNQRSLIKHDDYERKYLYAQTPKYSDSRLVPSSKGEPQLETKDLSNQIGFNFRFSPISTSDYGFTLSSVDRYQTICISDSDTFIDGDFFQNVSKCLWQLVSLKNGTRYYIKNVYHRTYISSSGGTIYAGNYPTIWEIMP